MKTQHYAFWGLLLLFILSPFLAQSQRVSYKLNEGIIRVKGEPWAKLERQGGLTFERMFTLSTLNDENIAFAREIIHREEDVSWFRIYFPSLDIAIEYRTGVTSVGKELAEAFVMTSIIEDGLLNEKGVKFFCGLYADESRRFGLQQNGDYMLVRKKQ
jgi:hypothetical protein